MEIVVKSKNLDISDSLDDYIEKKLAKLDRYLANIEQAEIDLSSVKARSAQDRQVAQITLRGGNGLILRAEERSSDLRASIDTAIDKISRQIKRYKGKHWQTHGRGLSREEIEPEALETEPDLAVVRTKRFDVSPMDVDEAIEQMELLGHDFFVFYNTGTDSFSVIYRRRDQGYGLLLPELA